MSTRQKNPQKTFKEDFQLTDRLMETIESIGMAMIEQGLFSSAFATFSLLMRLDPIKPSYVLWAAHSAYQEAQYLKASELYTLYMLLDFEEKTFLPYLIDAQIRCQREEAAKQIFEHMKEFLSEDEIDIQKQCEALLLRISSKPK